MMDLKKFKDLVLVFKCNNEIKIERFQFMSNEVYELLTFIWWKANNFFSKVHFEKNKNNVENLARMF
jgi:hypothetical protein